MLMRLLTGVVYVSGPDVVWSPPILTRGHGIFWFSQGMPCSDICYRILHGSRSHIPTIVTRLTSTALVCYLFWEVIALFF